MVKTYLVSILLALLAIGYVTSASHELPEDNLEKNGHDQEEATQEEATHELINQRGGYSSQLTEELSDDNGYDQGEAMEDAAPLSIANGEQEEAEEEQALSSSAVVHGNTIALQPLYDKRNYLGCAGNPCRKATCPGLYMEGTDWTRCWGEVFRIYRRSGPGGVRVGDDVGIYYPRERGKWLGCSGRNCGKAPCPGPASMRYGFSSQSRWTACWGEVFKIYARGKGVGSPIYSHDHVMLYYTRGRRWVGLVGTYSDLRTCPGTTRPPSKNKYDRCWGEVFDLWKH